MDAASLLVVENPLQHRVMMRNLRRSAPVKAREELFKKAHKWIDDVVKKGGVGAPVQKKFQKKKSKDIRIDIEVKTGEAFVPD